MSSGKISWFFISCSKSVDLRDAQTKEYNDVSQTRCARKVVGGTLVDFEKTLPILESENGQFSHKCHPNKMKDCQIPWKLDKPYSVMTGHQFENVMEVLPDQAPFGTGSDSRVGHNQKVSLPGYILLATRLHVRASLVRVCGYRYLNLRNWECDNLQTYGGVSRGNGTQKWMVSFEARLIHDPKPQNLLVVVCCSCCDILIVECSWGTFAAQTRYIFVHLQHFLNVAYLSATGRDTLFLGVCIQSNSGVF